MIREFIKSNSQKDKSLKQLYTLIRHYGPISKATLSDLSELKQTTCSRLIDELFSAGLIIEAGFGESSGGRKPVMYHIDPSVYYLVGVDISRTYTKVLLMDLNSTILSEAQMSIDQQSTPNIVLQFITDQIEDMLAQQNLDHSKLLGIGVGAVGPINREQGVILNPLHFPAPGWENIHIKEILEMKFQTSVYLENGANTAVIGEYRHGLGKQTDNLIYTIAGIGIRCGRISNGRVIRGPVDMEDAFDHIIVDIHGRKCTCGNFGCLTTYGTIPAIKEEIIRCLKRGHPSILHERLQNYDDLQLPDISQAVEENDVLCCKVVTDAAVYFGVGLMNVIYSIHPKMIILGGALITRMDLFYQVATETALKRAHLPPGYQVTFSKGALGQHAVAIGAGTMVFDYYLR